MKYIGAKHLFRSETPVWFKFRNKKRPERLLTGRFLTIEQMTSQTSVKIAVNSFFPAESSPEKLDEPALAAFSSNLPLRVRLLFRVVDRGH
jgi:hypothetical protein